MFVLYVWVRAHFIACQTSQVFSQIQSRGINVDPIGLRRQGDIAKYITKFLPKFDFLVDLTGRTAMAMFNKVKKTIKRSVVI